MYNDLKRFYEESVCGHDTKHHELKSSFTPRPAAMLSIVTKPRYMQHREEKDSPCGPTIYCFSCNRRERHLLTASSRMAMALLVTCTCGLYFFFGKYRCHCCAATRLLRYDFISPNFWHRQLLMRKDGVKSRRRKKKRRRQ